LDHPASPRVDAIEEPSIQEGEAEMNPKTAKAAMDALGGSTGARRSPVPNLGAWRQELVDSIAALELIVAALVRESDKGADQIAATVKEVLEASKLRDDDKRQTMARVNKTLQRSNERKS
jgi:hypothetical protein